MTRCWNADDFQGELTKLFRASDQMRAALVSRIAPRRELQRLFQHVPAGAFTPLGRPSGYPWSDDSWTMAAQPVRAAESAHWSAH